MITKNGLAAFAGYDPLEREVGRTGNPLSERTKALMAARVTLNRYAQLRYAARLNPPTPARGGFPYFQADGR